jgi:hypothetical protein
MNLTTEHLGKRMTRAGWVKEAWFLVERLEGAVAHGINQGGNGELEEWEWPIVGEWSLWTATLEPMLPSALETAIEAFGCHGEKIRALLTAWEAHLVEKYGLSEPD